MQLAMKSEITSAVPPARFAAAIRVLEEAIAARAFPGCAFGVLAGGEVVLAGARGRFTYDEAALRRHARDCLRHGEHHQSCWQPPPRRCCCISAACSIWRRLWANCCLALSRAERERSSPAHHAAPSLAHNSGLPGYIEFFRTAATADTLMQACMKLRLDSEPGACAEYSDPGFILLGKALEEVTGESLASWAQREIFLPLGLTATSYSPPGEARSLIPPTEEDVKLRHRRIQGEVQDENAWLLGGVAGHAGIFSHVPDLLRVAQEILDATAHQQNARLFNAATVELFARRQGPAGSSRALGWDTPSENSSSGNYFSPHSIGHLGYSGCSLWIDLEARIAIVLLTNRKLAQPREPIDSPGAAGFS